MAWVKIQHYPVVAIVWATIEVNRRVPSAISVACTVQLAPLFNQQR
jgi:hypothetical protein